MDMDTEYIERDDKTTFSIRLPTDVHQQLKQVAKRQRRSMNQSIILAVEMWLKSMETMTDENHT
jgi:predicted HicB family RNase H-like nuclease